MGRGPVVAAPPDRLTVDVDRLPVTYVLPLKAAAPRIDLAGYLEEVSGWVAQVVVVDGSAPDVAVAHARAWPDTVEQAPVDADLTDAFGKVNGVLTGLRRGRCEAVVLADDDVRYTRRQLAEVARLLATAEAVVPANYFSTLPWHARWDTARTLINRAFGSDYPGTLGVRRSLLAATDGYDGDVLFENLELLRTVRAAGGTVAAAPGVLVARQAPPTRHFATQRVRQAYDSFAQPWRQAAELALLPALAVTARLRGAAGLAAAAAVTIAVAEVGRRRARGRAAFPASTALFAPAWVAERAVCAWLAVGCRLVLGGVPYPGVGVLRRAATPQRVLDRRHAHLREELPWRQPTPDPTRARPITSTTSS